MKNTRGCRRGECGTTSTRTILEWKPLSVVAFSVGERSVFYLHQSGIQFRDILVKPFEYLHLAALLHDIGKFRKRGIDNAISHQEHSFAFVSEDFADFFSPCGEDFKDAIRNHHTEGKNLAEKQVILADRLSATESEAEAQEVTALLPVLSRLKDAANRDKQYGYTPTPLRFDSATVIPTESVVVDQQAYTTLWQEFKNAFCKATKGKTYEPALYQTIVALLHKYTSRIPSETVKTTESDISLYDHLRTTAAIAASIGRELTEVSDVEAVLGNLEKSEKKICALIKGDLSGIQNFLYHILSDGAARQLRGRSFYLQLLTEAIAHYTLKRLNLPITNLLLASGGHFYILAPYRDTQQQFDTHRQEVSDRLWALHQGELYCILDYAPVTAGDFKAENFSNKWGEVSDRVNARKQKVWSELEKEKMFESLFKPYENKSFAKLTEDGKDPWKFDELGQNLRRAKYLVAFDVPADSNISETPDWRAAIKAFGLHIRLPESRSDLDPEDATHAVVYRLRDTNFLEDIDTYQWDEFPASYDFRMFRPVITYRREEVPADYTYLAEASEGVKWLGALRMDIDDLGAVFIEKLQNATISRLATLSEALCLFFEGYVPELCNQYNVELIYAGGDDLFLVGGWSALPEIAREIRSEFGKFVTGDHVTLSGGIAIEHDKYPLYQFAAESGDAEKASKNRPGKDAITFLRKTMAWGEFDKVSAWHRKFLRAIQANRDPLPRGVLTRLSQIYSEDELKEHRWAWRSLYYFHRLQERYKSQKTFLEDLKCELNHPETEFELQKFIHIVTRWTALRARNKGD